MYQALQQNWPIRAVWLAVSLLFSLAPVVQAASVHWCPAERGVASGRTLSCAPLLRNGDFEAGPDGSWDEEVAPNCQEAGGPCELINNQYTHNESLYGADLGGYNGASDTLSQAVAIPANAERVTLSYWWAIDTEETTGGYDFCFVELDDENGDLLALLEAITGDDQEIYVWHRSEFDLTAYKGHTVRLVFHAYTDDNQWSEFFIDDVDLEACEVPLARLSYLPLVMRP